MAEHTPLGLTRAVQGILISEPEDWWVRDLTQSYPWLGEEELLWLIDEENDASAIVMHLPSGEWVCINRPEGLVTISKAIRNYLAPVPSEQFGVTDLATLLMEWYEEPRGYVCSPEFLEANEKVLESFQGNETDLNVLRSLCSVPAFSQSAGTWRLEYNVLNKNGGVDHWVVIGNTDPFDVSSIEVESLKPDETFYYPDEF